MLFFFSQFKAVYDSCPGNSQYDAGMEYDYIDTTTPFGDLLPDVVLAAIEALGFVTDGRLLALNSYENRVWQVGLENGPPIIAKFYRPNRWSDEAILEEHAFGLELVEHELPIVPPMVVANASLHFFQGHRFALFKRFGGHAPEVADKETLKALGRLMGRIHAIGAQRKFAHREVMHPDDLGRASIAYLLEHDWVPMHLISAFESTTQDLMQAIDAIWQGFDQTSMIRLHGDCHPGNILWRDGHAHFVDLDDCRMGPAIQDLWMWLSGDRDERSQQITWLIDEYQAFFAFNPRELHLIEALRTLRMIHYQAWLARRWSDPAFPQAFGWFEQPRHWESVIEQLREQLDEIHQTPIEIQRS